MYAYVMTIKLPKVSVPKFKFNKNIAIKTAFIVVALVAFAGLVTAVNNHWQEQKQIKEVRVAAEQKAAAEAAEKAKSDKAKLDRAATVQAEYDRVYLECLKGEEIYAKALSTGQKNIYSKTKPVCGIRLPAL